jgi:hypothetical protein
VPLGIVSGVVGVAAGLNSLFGGGGGGSGPSSGQVSQQQLQEQATVFGEQQGFEQQLYNLIKNPSSVTSLPGYSFFKQQGQDSLVRSGAAGGYLGSGNLGAGLVKYGQDYASNFYNQQVGVLAQLAGLAVNPASYGSAATTGAANQTQQFNNLMYQLGALGGTIGSTYSPFGGGGGGSFTGGPFDNVQPGGGYIPPDSAPPTFVGGGASGGGGFGGGLG